METAAPTSVTSLTAARTDPTYKEWKLGAEVVEEAGKFGLHGSYLQGMET